MIEKTQKNNIKTHFSNKFILMISFLILICASAVCFAFKKDTPAQNIVKPNTPAQILAQIDELQARYFAITDRINASFDNDDKNTKADAKKLEMLFSQVEKNIDKNNYYLQKYREIEKKYTENSGETTADMANFAVKHVDSLDNLLNEIYQNIKKKLPEEDFNQLKRSEILWIKEVEKSYELFNQEEYGTMGILLKLGSEINMKSFRILLLMLYL